MKNEWNAPEPTVTLGIADTTILLVRHTIQHLLSLDTDGLKAVEMAQLSALVDDFRNVLSEVKDVLERAQAKTEGRPTEKKEPWL